MSDDEILRVLTEVAARTRDGITDLGEGRYEVPCPECRHQGFNLAYRPAPLTRQELLQGLPDGARVTEIYKIPCDLCHGLGYREIAT